ncbi:unnamed protein product, partial [Symbiodinium microadriaticum]
IAFVPFLGPPAALWQHANIWSAGHRASGKGAPGEIRVCYANLAPEKCAEAARRLKAGLSELRENGPTIFQ